MKNKTTVTQQHLNAAIKSLPKENIFSSIKMRLKHIAEELKTIDNKRVKKDVAKKTIAAEWNEKITANAKPLNPKDALKAIEDMIALEQSKQKKESNKTKITKNETLLD